VPVEAIDLIDDYNIEFTRLCVCHELLQRWPAAILLRRNTRITVNMNKIPV
jgi:hypothetical protein